LRPPILLRLTSNIHTMATENTSLMIPDERIMDKIYLIRDQKVMLDRDLAELYGLETKVLKQQVRRNLSRFPEDFMFELTNEELENWRSQFVTSNSDRMGLRHAPMAFIGTHSTYAWREAEDTAGFKRSLRLHYIIGLPGHRGESARRTRQERV